MMRKTFLTALAFLANFVSAQGQLNDYYDAVSANRAEFSYHVTVGIQKNEGATNDAQRYTATLLQASPDPKGYYNAHRDNKLYTCSQLGTVCNPDNIHLMSVKLLYNCNGQQKSVVISFRNLNEQKFVPVVLGAGGKFCDAADFTSMEVMGAPLEPTHLGQILDKINQTGTTKTTQNNSNKNNPVTSTGAANTGNPMQNTTAKPVDNYDSNTGLYTNPMGNISTGSSAVDSFTKGYAQGEQIVAVASGLIDLFTPSPEEQKRREEERQRVRAAALKKEAEEKAMWNDYTTNKVLDKYIAAANGGNENARMVLMFEIFRLTEIKDMTHLVPNLKSWIEEAVQNKNLDAMNFVGYHSIYNVRPFVNLKYTKDDGLKMLEEAAALNSGDAMYTLGDYYDRIKMPNWTTVSKEGGGDPEKAFAYFSKAAALNHPHAMYVLAEIYLQKYPAKKNKWFVTYTVEKNSELGCTYMYNSLYPKDYQETLYQKFGIHYTKFRRHMVFKELSDRYANGTGCAKDEEMAKKLAAEIEKSSYEYSMKYYR